LLTQILPQALSSPLPISGWLQLSTVLEPQNFPWELNRCWLSQWRLEFVLTQAASLVFLMEILRWILWTCHSPCLNG
jgi:hypothetical protein